MELNLISIKDSGKDSNKKIAVNEAVFNCDFNEGLVHQVVVALQARMRAGTVAQKTRAEVRGGGIKPWRQKGTGRARAGSIRSPIWRKGGVIFAAKPRDYEQKVNKKMYKKSICSILSELIRQGRLIVCDEFDCEKPKTKIFKDCISNLAKKSPELNAEDILIICSDVNANMYLATRNLPHVQIVDVAGIDPVSLIRHETVLITSDALHLLNSQLGGV
jgi:large subunit ribosomal protein L4